MTSLYVPTIESAQQMLLDVGGDIFGEEIIAYDVGQDLWRAPDGADPRIIGWYTFYGILEDCGSLDDAFTSAWNEQRVMRFIVRRGLTMPDAEDVKQNTMIQAWKSLHHFKPWRGHWIPWLLNIAQWRVTDFLRKEWYTDQIPVSFDEIDAMLDRQGSGNRRVHPDSKYLSSTFVITKRGWSVPIVCKRWIEESRSPERARFAQIILQNYYGYDWVGPTGTKMEDLVGNTYRKQLWIWWHELINEVLSSEQGEL